MSQPTCENIGSGSVLSVYDTSVIAYDFEFDGNPSKIELTVDGVLKVKVDEFTVDFPGLVFTDNKIEPKNLTAGTSTRYRSIEVVFI